MAMKKMTIADVSALTGVSAATVSRILRQKGNVKPETRRKVLDAIKNADMEGGLLGRFQNSKKWIVAVVTDTSIPVLVPFIEGLRQSAAAKGYHLIEFPCDPRGDLEKEFALLCDELPVAGLVFHDTLKDLGILDSLASKVATVMGFEDYMTKDISCVGVDYRKAARSAVEYLLSIGRKKIALLGSDVSLSPAARKQEGYIEALRGAGVEVRDEYILNLADINYNLALHGAAQLLSLEDRPDAFFAATDSLAAAIIKESHRMGLCVPRDIAVVGFDDTEISTTTDPAITTVIQPCYQIGYQACSLLVEKINNPGIPSKQVWIDTEFIVRGSTQ